MTYNTIHAVASTEAVSISHINNSTQTKSRSPVASDELILKHQGYARSLVTDIAKTLPRSADFDELLGYGLLGLTEAAREFDPRRGAAFTTFAYYRIRGAVFDGIRKMTWLPPAARRKATAAAAADAMIGLSTLDVSSSDPDAEAFDRALQTLGAVYVLSGTDEGTDASTAADPAFEADPLDAMIRVELRTQMFLAMDELDDAERRVIRWVYVDGLSFSEIGAKLGVHKSTVCRDHARILHKLRGGMSHQPGE